MPGPKNPSYLFGNHKQLTISRLHTSDLKALNHVVTNPTVYQRIPAFRELIRHSLGDGLLSVKPDDHQGQRRIIASGNQTMPSASPKFASSLMFSSRRQLSFAMSGPRSWHRDLRPGIIDVLGGLRRTTLDIIGKAGFDHEFNALDATGKPNELNEVFTELFHTKAAQRTTAFRNMTGTFPALRILPLPGQRMVDASRRKMLAISAQIVADSKGALSGSDVEKI
ncbi:hypothetical protein B0H16DRAFT_1711037 [Mycena metata]|uniref:Cytochrome P450 n=1 Tax=Mycena metata TaxID=1033252 RepID=A0AAD7K790_9AGAR|nr:hypothetical protein B0H16DRAFT_1711037 [Mycena metata]